MFLTLGPLAVWLALKRLGFSSVLWIWPGAFPRVDHMKMKRAFGLAYKH
jgi:hypothetical protein